MIKYVNGPKFFHLLDLNLHLVDLNLHMLGLNLHLVDLNLHFPDSVALGEIEFVAKSRGKPKVVDV